MKNDYQHIDPFSNPENEQEGFFHRVEIPFAKSKEEVWANLEERINNTPSPRISNFKFHRLTLALAASVILLAGIFSLLRFYTTTVHNPAGQHQTHTLPDGSTAALNSESKLSYKAFWWRFEREIKFEGEAYFKVEKGKKFQVISSMGKTEVLGTSFNIYSRGNEYNVTCYTGQVKVTSSAEKEVVLSPDYEARVDSEGNITVIKEISSGVNISWINNMFHFTARPLPMVINEIARQYNIRITSKLHLDYSYTGYFSKERTPEEVLALVCKPFGLTFARISGKEYEIYQNPD